MKKALLFAALSLVLSQLKAQVIYVSEGGNGDGSSWAAAMGSLQKALGAAPKGGQVWVSRGTYRTAENNDRSKSFIIPAGIELYGGFAGFETAPGQRNLNDNITYLSGEIGTASPHDNAYTVVYTKNVGEHTVVDGFYITAGVANGSDKSNPLEIRGAGWFNLAIDGESGSPTIRNCTIAGNHAREGGGLYNLAMKKGTCQPVVTKCSFVNNKADLKGGAIMNITMDGTCIPEITACLFDSNHASYGAGIYNEPKFGNVAPLIRNNIFKNNIATVRNGSIHNEYTGYGSCQPTIEGNHFEGNAATVGQEKESLPKTKKQASGYE